MKKVLVAGAVALVTMVNAQTKFGANAGMLVGSAKAEAPGMSETNSSTGFYAGFFAEINAGNKIKIQPTVNYANIEDESALQIPVMVKYYVDPKFNLQFGPQFLFDLSDIPAELDQYYNKTNFAVAFGGAYEFTDKFFAEARYSVQLNNHLKNAPSGYSVKANYLNIGIGYKFN
ncbi:porin family protein [Kaistella faecalis]|uniref:porin family protein n=1 Tax=Kaistella faecalis TaxID=2852098 RepID=UPI001C4753D9|nr:porin family protein [Chryseobacterium faecale]UFK97491.1 PorT family protein [Chryseobacterium faecale]